MDMTKITETVLTAAEQITEGQGASPMPPITPTTPKGKIGYNHLIDAMNRLPRPIMALATLGLFLVAAINPAWFEARMQALSAMPEPMWWILGAVITFFFGAREAHYIRSSTQAKNDPAR